MKSYCKRCRKDTERYKSGECITHYKADAIARGIANAPCKKCGAADRLPSGACRPCNRTYRKSRKGIAATARYRQSPKCTATKTAYNKSPEGKAVRWTKLGMPIPSRPCPDLCEWKDCTRKAMDADHCHVTGLFRGWLCNFHNRSLGNIGDTLQDLRKGVEYLERAESEFWLAIPGNGLPKQKRVLQ